MSAHSHYLKRKQTMAQEAVDAHVLRVDATTQNVGPMPIVFDNITTGFLNVIDSAAREISCVEKFETDVIQLVNPTAGIVDKCLHGPLLRFAKRHMRE